MDTLRAMQVFVEVAKQGGFAQAARKLGLSTSSVSRHVVKLEDMFGAQLFRRTSRHLALTPVGEDVLKQCDAVVQSVDALFNEKRGSADTPQGRLRVTMPNFLGAILMDGMITEFASTYEHVELEVLLTDRLVNLTEEGFDLALRVGRLSDSTMLSRKILDLGLALVAAPDYLARRGAPENLDDLKHHNCIVDTAAPYRDRWPFEVDGAPERRQVRGNVSVNSGSAAHRLAVGGVGLALVPEYLVFEDVGCGRLTRLMDAYVVNYGGVFVVYPPSRHQVSAIRAFIDLLIHHSKPIRAYRERHLEAWREQCGSLSDE